MWEPGYGKDDVVYRADAMVTTGSVCEDHTAAEACNRRIMDFNRHHVGLMLARHPVALAGTSFEAFDKHRMLNVLDFHLVSSRCRINRHCGIHPYPDPDPRFNLFPNLSIGKLVDIPSV